MSSGSARAASGSAAANPGAPQESKSAAAEFAVLVAEESQILAVSEELIARATTTGISRFDWADSAGMSAKHLTNLLAGDRDMTLREFSRLAGALGYRVIPAFARNANEETGR